MCAIADAHVNITAVSSLLPDFPYGGYTIAENTGKLDYLEEKSKVLVNGLIMANGY